jgi:TonB family protein
MLRGYKSQSKKADLSKDMKIVMVKDPGYQEQQMDQEPVTADQPLIILDGEITKEPLSVIHSKFRDQLGPTERLTPKQAILKYGDAGRNGAIEIYTRKKAEELGLKNTFKRTRPADFPTFMGGVANTFSQWVADNTEYPAEAVSKDIRGRVSLSYRVEPDGTLSDIKGLGQAHPILTDAVIKAMNSAPKWEPAINPDIKEPYVSFVNIRFELPNKIRVDKSYVVAEKMPEYPGGDKALREFISQNTKYPEDMKDLKITGRVIVRFLVNYEGTVTEEMILKGVHPKLDAEALRVVKLLKGWQPGMQDGRPVDVWYMVPFYFYFEQADRLLSGPEAYESLFSGESGSKILRFIGENARYPATARSSSTEGKVYVKVKMEKGGIVRECKAARVKDGMDVPLLPEVVIVGYRSDKNKNPDDLRLNKNVKGPGAWTDILESEALRVANLLGKVNAPEWLDKDMEFAVQLNFTLK